MKEQYRIRNWSLVHLNLIQVLASDRLPRSEHNAGLKRRGSIIFWFSTDVIDEWLVKEKTGTRGASTTYNDVAIATISTIKSVFSLAGRQAQGFVESVLKLMNMEKRKWLSPPFNCRDHYVSA